MGGLLIVVSGTLSWWGSGSSGTTGLELMRGRAAFSFGVLLGGIGLLRAATTSLEIRLTSVAAGLLFSIGVIALALVEREQALSLPEDILYFFRLRSMHEGFYLTLYGGMMGFIGSLCGLAPDPAPDGAPTHPSLP